MKTIITISLLLLSLTASSQEKILNQCFVFVLDTEVKTDLRNATFDLPFAAMSESKEGEKRIVPHYAIDIQAADAVRNTSDNGISVLSIRSYEYGETLGDNEIAFFVLEWPDNIRPDGMGPIVASFPSLNKFKVTTDHLLINEPLELSEKMVSQLGLASNVIAPGTYRVGLMEVEY